MKEIRNLKSRKAILDHERDVHTRMADQLLFQKNIFLPTKEYS